MIRKLVKQMLSAQIFSALTVSLCLLIDNIVIGSFLGEKVWQSVVPCRRVISDVSRSPQDQSGTAE